MVLRPKGNLILLCQAEQCHTERSRSGSRSLHLVNIFSNQKDEPVLLFRKKKTKFTIWPTNINITLYIS